MNNVERVPISKEEHRERILSCLIAATQAYHDLHIQMQESMRMENPIHYNSDWKECPAATCAGTFNIVNWPIEG